MSEDQAEKQLRSRLARELKRGDIPDPVWNNLMSRGLVADVLKEEYGLDELVADARVQLKTYQETLGRGGTPVGRARASSREPYDLVEPELKALEKTRAQALGEWVALRAALDPDVRYFRKLILGGELLGPDQAYSFVSSPANWCFPVVWFVERQIPMRVHYSCTIRDGLAEDEEGEECRFDDIYIEPPGETFRKVTYYPYDFGHRDMLRFPPRLYHERDFFHEVDKIAVESGSVLDVLRRVSRRLAEAFGHAWNEAQAAWFVLTGEATPVVALIGGIEASYGDKMTHGVITLKAEPWVSAQTVERYYRKMQKMMLEGKDNRPLSEKGLALFRFVVRQRAQLVPEVAKIDPDTLVSDGGEVDVVPSEDELRQPKLTGGPSWRALQERWNRECERSEWRYKDVRNFQRAYRSVARPILVPAYDDPEELALFSKVTWP